MKRIIVLLVVVAFIGIVAPVYATSPHFVNASGSITSNGALSVNWKEAGLGNNLFIDYLATTDSTAIYACINGGENHPKAGNKVTVSGPLYANGTFASGKNGQITASLSFGPLGPGDFSCPNGQRLQLANVSYWNVSLWDMTNNIPAPIPGGFCRQFVNLPEFACP
ncbi:MAG: hypothetical protein ACM3JD_08165 [Rudaea sp.]